MGLSTSTLTKRKCTVDANLVPGNKLCTDTHIVEKMSTVDECEMHLA